jgi:hypothetical protein
MAEQEQASEKVRLVGQYGSRSLRGNVYRELAALFDNAKTKSSPEFKKSCLEILLNKHHIVFENKDRDGGWKGVYGRVVEDFVPNGANMRRAYAFWEVARSRLDYRNLFVDEYDALQLKSVYYAAKLIMCGHFNKVKNGVWHCGLPQCTNFSCRTKRCSKRSQARMEQVKRWYGRGGGEGMVPVMVTFVDPLPTDQRVNGIYSYLKRTFVKAKRRKNKFELALNAHMERRLEVEGWMRDEGKYGKQVVMVTEVVMLLDPGGAGRTLPQAHTHVMLHMPEGKEQEYGEILKKKWLEACPGGKVLLKSIYTPEGEVDPVEGLGKYFGKRMSVEKDKTGWEAWHQLNAQRIKTTKTGYIYSEDFGFVLCDETLIDLAEYEIMQDFKGMTKVVNPVIVPKYRERHADLSIYNQHERGWKKMLKTRTGRDGEISRAAARLLRCVQEGIKVRGLGKLDVVTYWDRLKTWMDAWQKYYPERFNGVDVDFVLANRALFV